MGRTALVTGASRGIGRAIAIELGKRGYKVAVNFQNSSSAAQETVETIRSSGGEAQEFRADVSNRAEVKDLFKAVNDAFGQVEVLVNNAGITRDQLLMRLSEEDWCAVIDTNLSSVYSCTQAAVRPMIKANFGRIINISSVVGLQGNAGQANYAAAKAGIIGFTKAIARELGGRGITANVVAPGFTETDMTNVLSDEIKAKSIEIIPAGRFGRPEDIANAVAFFASDESSYVNGQVLAVDGGMTTI